MSNDVQKLKKTYAIFKKENSDFKRYNGHLRSAIIQVSESNEKLLYSLHQKYNYFGDLEYQNKRIEDDIQNKLWNFENFDFANKKSKQKQTNPYDFSNESNKINLDNINRKISNSHKNAQNKAIDDKISNHEVIQNENDHEKLSQIEDNHDSSNKNLKKSTISNGDNIINSDDSAAHENVKHSMPTSDISGQNNQQSNKLNNKLDSANNSILDHSLKQNSESNSNSKYSQKSVKSLVMQSFSASSADSIEKLKQKQNLLYETNQKLKTEIELLLTKAGETDLFIQFQKESDSYLKALRELREIQNHLNQNFSAEQSEDDQQLQINHKISSENILNDKQNHNHNHSSGVFLTDVESKPVSEQNSDINNVSSHFNQKPDKVDRSCQTNDNMRSRSIVKYFSKGTHQNYLVKQNNKIAIRRKSIVDLASEIEKQKHSIEENITKKTQITAILTQLQNVSVIDIYNTNFYEDKETETDEHIDFDSIISQIEENKKYTKEYLMRLNKKFNLQSIYDQKSIELKLAQSSTDHKTANYRSLLRNLKNTDPDCYAKFIGTVGMSSKDEQKRQRYLHQINKFTEKIKKADIQTKEIEIKEKKVKLRIEILERELSVFKNPKDHMKSALTNLCQVIALDQEKIRDNMREMAFIKLEIDFLDRIKTRILKKTSKISEINLKNSELAMKLKKIKGRCRYSLRSGQNYPITSPSELDLLQEIFDITENEVKSFDEKIDVFSKKSVSFFKQLATYKLNAPPTTNSCHTIQKNLKNVL